MKAIKEHLIRETIRISKEYNTVCYGLINGECIYPTTNERIAKERILEGYKVYCKADKGYLTI